MTEYEKGILNAAHAFKQSPEYKWAFGEQEIDKPENVQEFVKCALCGFPFKSEEINPNGMCVGCHNQELMEYD